MNMEGNLEALGFIRKEGGDASWFVSHSERSLVNLREDAVAQAAQVVHNWGIISFLQVQHASHPRQEESGLEVPRPVVGFGGLVAQWEDHLLIQDGQLDCSRACVYPVSIRYIGASQRRRL